MCLAYHLRVTTASCFNFTRPVRTSAHAINQELNMPIVHSIIGYENPRSRRR
jgi:hypothetical protein